MSEPLVIWLLHSVPLVWSFLLDLFSLVHQSSSILLIVLYHLCFSFASFKHLALIDLILIQIMDDLPDTAGHFDGFGFSAGSGNDSFNLYHNNYTSTDEVMFSPVVESRHGSVNSLSSPLQLSGFPGVQRYEADLQPDATPHFNIGHPYRSTDMSRETSYASHQSSMSSGQQYHGDQQAQWYSNDIPLSGTSMRRTVSLQADAANQQLLSPPSHNRVYSNHLYTGHTNAYSPVSSVVHFDDISYDGPLIESNINPSSNGTLHRGSLDFGFGNFGHA